MNNLIPKEIKNKICEIENLINKEMKISYINFSYNFDIRCIKIEIKFINYYKIFVNIDYNEFIKYDYLVLYLLIKKEIQNKYLNEIFY